MKNNKIKIGGITRIKDVMKINMNVAPHIKRNKEVDNALIEIRKEAEGTFKRPCNIPETNFLMQNDEGFFDVIYSEECQGNIVTIKVLDTVSKCQYCKYNNACGDNHRTVKCDGYEEELEVF